MRDDEKGLPTTEGFMRGVGSVVSIVPWVVVRSVLVYGRDSRCGHMHHCGHKGTMAMWNPLKYRLPQDQWTKRMSGL